MPLLQLVVLPLLLTTVRPFQHWAIRNRTSVVHKTITIVVPEAPATDSKNNLETFLFSEIKKGPTL
ncbi:hypothetical protein LH53_01400 [Mesotoga sp. TolDC]|nr:hypothetical protein LH53_01400 [Mesotoga sp. TolDC]